MWEVPSSGSRFGSYVRMHVCMHVKMYVCMYVCVCTYVCVPLSVCECSRVCRVSCESLRHTLFVKISLLIFNNFVAVSLFLFPFSVRVDASQFCAQQVFTVFNVTDVKVSNENGYLFRSMSTVFQPLHPDTASPFGQGECDCSASGTGYAF